jgi:uncharacterized protein (TIGR02266 family)
MGKDTSGSFIEKRQSPRVQYQTQVTVTSEHNFYTGLSLDISEGGIFIATHQPLPMGTEVEIEFSIPNFPEAIRAVGRVQWVREFSYSTSDVHPGMGVQFLKISPPQAIPAIQTFIKRVREPVLYER